MSSVRLTKILTRYYRDRILREGYEIDGFYNPESEALKVLTALFDPFYENIQASAAKPLILLLPNRKECVEPLQAYWQETALEHFQRRAYDFHDLSESLPIQTGQQGLDTGIFT